MEIRAKRGSVIRFLLIVSAITIPICYLNCSGAPNGAANLASQSGNFPYQMHADTIAYMSCSNLGGTSTNTQEDPTNVFYNFKVSVNNVNNCDTKSGADAAGCGVGFAPQFASMSASDEAALLQSYQNVYPDLSIRPANDLVDGYATAYISSQCSTDCGDQSYGDANMLGASLLLSNFTSIFYSGSEIEWHNSSSSSTGIIPFGSQISFNGGQNDGAGKAIRNAITEGSGQWYLTTEFSTASGIGVPGQGVSSDGSNQHVYGYGYRFTFKNGQYQSTGPARAVSTVSEYDLASGKQTGSSWSCENFEIIYPGDIGRAAGGVPQWVPLANPQPANALQAAAIQSLPGWQFDEYGNFAVPPPSVTSGDFCDGNLQMHAAGSYSASSTLYFDSSKSGGGTCSASADNCPHLVSICVRN